MKNILKKNVLQKFFLLVSLGFILLPMQAQVIDESFEETTWTTVSGSGTVNVAATTLSLTYYNAYTSVSSTAQTTAKSTVSTTNTKSTTTISVTSTKSTSAVGSSTCTASNASGNWMYSGATYSSTTASALKSIRTLSGSIKLNDASSYIITPILSDGISSVTFWMTGSKAFTVGLLTGTNTTTELPANLNLDLTTALSETNAQAGTSIRQVTYSISYSEPCQFVIQGASSSAFIDDIQIFKAVILPQLTSPTANAVTVKSTTDFTASWNDVSDEVGYIVKVYNADGALVKTENSISANLTSYQISGLKQNTEYTYTVTAVGDAVNYRNSKESAPISFRTISSEKAITSFKLLNTYGIIDETNKKINVAVPFTSILPGSYEPIVAYSNHAVLLTSGTQNFTEGGSLTYTIQAEDGTKQDYTVTVTRADASKACSIVSISGFATMEAINYDPLSLTYTIFVPSSTNLSSLNPVIDFSALSKSTPKPTDYTTPQTITVTAEDGITKKTYTIKVVKDDIPPQLVSSKPLNAAIGVSLGGVMTLNYDESLTLVPGATISISGGGQVSSILTTDSIVKFNFKGLAKSTTYTVTIPSKTFVDNFGNYCAESTITFTTANDILEISQLPYASYMNGQNFEVPAFISGDGINYNSTVDVRGTTTTKFGGYVIPPGKTLTIKTQSIGSVLASIYSKGGMQYYKISTNTGLTKSDSLLRYKYSGQDLVLENINKTDINNPIEIYISNETRSFGNIYIPYLYLSAPNQVLFDERTKWCTSSK